MPALHPAGRCQRYPCSTLPWARISSKSLRAMLTGTANPIPWFPAETAILSGGSGGNQGIGFAVPVNMARHDLDEILAHGKVEHGYLGILPQDVTPALAKAFSRTKRTERWSDRLPRTAQPPVAA